MPNLQLVPKENLSSFRRIAIGTWQTAYDPSVYGELAVPIDPALRYMEEFRRRTGRRITITHLLAKAAAIVMKEMPDANAILRFNRIYLRQDIGVFFQVAMEDAATGEIDLSGATVFGAHDMTLLQIMDDFEARVGKIRAGKDEALEGTRSTFKSIPFFALNFVLKTISFLGYTLNLDLRFAGIPKDPFGSVMITNVGSLGLQSAFVPLVPYSRVPLLIAVGAVREEPVVDNGAIVIKRMLHLFATFDHRVLDGMHASRMSKIIQRVFADPERELGALPPDDGAAAPGASR